MGFGTETAVHTLRLILSGLFDRCPQLRIILDHLGKGSPLPPFAACRASATPSELAEVRGRQLKPV